LNETEVVIVFLVCCDVYLLEQDKT